MSRASNKSRYPYFIVDSEKEKRKTKLGKACSLSIFFFKFRALISHLSFYLSFFHYLSHSLSSFFLFIFLSLTLSISHLYFYLSFSFYLSLTIFLPFYLRRGGHLWIKRNVVSKDSDKRQSHLMGVRVRGNSKIKIIREGQLKMIKRFISYWKMKWKGRKRGRKKRGKSLLKKSWKGRND